MNTAANPFPRVLFVTPHAFNHLTGGGVTFSNLFHGWPQDRLATVHCDHIPVTDDVCNRYFKLGRDELDVWRPIRRAADLMRWRAVADAPAVAAPVAPAAQSAPASLRPSWTSRVQSLFFESELPRFATLTPQLEAWIEAFKPDVLYTILGSNGVMDLVERIRVRFGLPLVVHIMDDWASSRHRHGLLEPILRRGMRRRLQHLFGAASRRMAICPAMSEAYEERHGLPFLSFQNAIDSGRWAATARTDGHASGAGDILYVGSVMPNAQLQSLVDCCHAVALLNERGQPATLTIAAPGFQVAPVRHLLEVHPSVRIVEPITDDAQFYARIAAADVLLLPVNFDEDSVRFIRYSMPTKVPAYLFSGTPVLVYGPAHLAQTLYASQEGWGLVQSRPGREELALALSRLLADGPLREALSARARQVAHENHDQQVVRERFRATLAAAAADGRNPA